MNSFKKGDYVVYSTNGVCLIDEIRHCTMPFTEKAQDYYILQPLHSLSSVLFVPVENKELTDKMRYVLTTAEINELLGQAKNKQIDWNIDRKARMAYFREITLRGDRCDLLLMIRCIYQQGQMMQECKKKLSASDEDFLMQAQRAINEEFSFALGISEDEVGPYIRRALEIPEGEGPAF